MFITYNEVRDYVKQAEPGSPVGWCGNAFKCLIAEAVNHKYPNVRSTSVSLSDYESSVLITTSPRLGVVQEVTTAGDGRKLLRLAEDFDNLGDYDHPVTREEALELFR